MRSSCKYFFFYFLLFANLISANGKNDIDSSISIESFYSKATLNPVITVSPSSLNQFTACLGSASATQTFTVSGSDLNNDITINAPAGYEISLNGTAWFSNLTLSPSSGVVPNTTISIRIKSTTTTIPNNSTISISSGSINQDITGINGTINNLPNITGTLRICEGSTSNLILNPAISGGTWSSSNTNVATVTSSGNVSGISFGTTTITFTKNGCSDSATFTVDNLPSISGSSNVCIGSTLQLNGTGTAATTNPWTSSTNNVIINSNGLITGINSGNSVITYVDSNGCSDTKNINVRALPNAIISTTTPTTFCSGGSVLLTANSGSGFTYVWKKNGIVISSETNSTYSATTSGDYTVTITNSSGCSSTSSITVVTENSVINPVLGPFGNTTQVTFQNLIYLARCTTQATASINIVNQTLNQSQVASYTINWGDGSANTTTNSFTSNLNHPYNQGFYTLTISLTTNQGCTSSKTYQIFVGNTPSGSLGNPGNLSGCAPKTITYPIDNVSNNTPGTQYIINFGDGQSITYVHPNVPSSITHTYNFTSCNNTFSNTGIASNSFVATMTTTNPCFPPAVTTVGPIIINEPPTPNFTISNNPSCINSTVNLLNTSITGVIVTQSGCNSDAPIYWTISPSTGWTATGLGSNGNVANDTDYWTNGVNNPSINFTIPGRYIVTLFIGNPCEIKSITKEICIESLLLPQFTLSTTSGCAPLAVTATNTTNLTFNCSTLNYLWNVTYSSGFCGNGINLNSTSTSQNPTFNFVTPGTYTIKVTISGNTCGTVTSLTQTVIVKQPPTVSINSISDYCLTASINPAAVINSCSNISSNNPTYLWSFSGGIPSTSSVLSPTNILYSNPGTYTVSLAVTNECGTKQAVDRTFTIYPSSVVGTASGNQTICQGTQPAALTLSSNLGNIQWQVSTTGFSGWTNINGATSSTLLLGTLNSTRYYQAVVTNGICPAVISNMVTITVNPTSSGGIASLNQTICSGNTPNALSLSGSVGTIQWQSSSLVNGPWTDIIGATTSTLTIGALTSTMYYQAVVTSGVCPSAISTKVTITVSQPSIAGTAGTDQTICQGSSPAPLTLSGNTGTIQWQYSTTGTSGWTNINLATGATLTSSQMGPLTSTSYYQAVVTNGACLSVISNMVTITVNPTSFGGTASLNQTICFGATPNALTLSGNTGAIQWQSSTNNSTFNNIVGETSPTLTLGALTSTMYYQAVVTSGVCPSATPSKVTITVSQPSVAGIASANQTICQGTPPTALILVGNTGTIEWQSSSSSIGPWTTISGAVGSTLTVAQMAVSSSTKYFQAVVTNGACPSVVSNMVTITVNPTSVGGTASTNQTICSGTTPNALTLSGNTGTIQWQSSTNNSTFNNIVGETSPTLTLGALTSTMYYQAVVTSGVCPSAISTKVTITVNPLPTINGTLNVCIGSTTQLSGSATAASSNPWVSSVPSTATVNNNSGLVTAVNTGTTIITYTNSNGCKINATINVNPLPTISGTLFVCKGSTTQLIGSGTPAITDAWVSSVPANATVNSTTGLVTALNSGTTIITYTNSNGCKIPATITVNPLGQVNTTANQSLCDGGIVNVNFTTNNVPGTTVYDWTSSQTPNVGLQATGSGNISFTASNIGSGIATSTIVVTPTYTNGGVSCPGPSSQFAISVYPPPTISVHPTPTQDICVGGTVPAFNVAYINGYGNPDYQWFYNTSPTIIGATTISGAINPTYTPPSFLATGTYYYFARVCLNGLGCGCVFSNIAVVNVYGDPNATITPSTQTICQNTPPIPIVVSASAGIPNGIYTYQWYSNVAPNTIGGLPLVPAVTTSTFIPPTNTVQTNYYYCIISNGLNCNYTTDVVRVVTVAAPIAYLQPTPTQTVCLNGTPTTLAIALINGTGTPTYQWYSNTVNALGGTAITGATSLSYVPPTSATGTLYYYCIATYNSGGCTTATSNIAQVVVNPIQTITTQPLVTQDICIGGTIPALTVAYTGGVGTATYQWYSNSTNTNSGGLLISGATLSSYTPSVFTTAGDYYYYATVTLSGSGCNSVSSTTALVHVVADPTVSITPSSQTICQGTTPTDLVVTPSGGVGKIGRAHV